VFEIRAGLVGGRWSPCGYRQLQANHRYILGPYGRAMDEGAELEVGRVTWRFIQPGTTLDGGASRARVDFRVAAKTKLPRANAG